MNKYPFFVLTSLCLLLLIGSCKKADETRSQEGGFKQIFNGKNLDGWEGDSTYWSVEDGKLVGKITPETLLDRNSFIIWQGDMPSDFELKVEYRVTEEGNSGINYRSEKVEGIPYALRGYQADLDGQNRYTGMNYEERRRTTIAATGQKVVLPSIPHADSLQAYVKNNQWTASKVTGSLGDIDTLKASINDEAWNEYHLVVKGNRLKHYVNGTLMSDVTDRDTVNRSFDGLLGVQVHVGPPMRIEYRNFRIRTIE